MRWVYEFAMKVDEKEATEWRTSKPYADRAACEAALIDTLHLTHPGKWRVKNQQYVHDDNQEYVVALIVPSRTHAEYMLQEFVSNATSLLRRATDIHSAHAEPLKSDLNAALTAMIDALELDLAALHEADDREAVDRDS